LRNIGSGSTAASVVLVGLSIDEMGRVRETLVGEAVLPSNPVTYADAIQAIERNQPDVVIVSFAQGSEAPLAIATAITKDHPQVALVALAEESDADVILSAMRVGYKDIVVLPGDAQRLRQAVHEAAFAVSEEEAAGTVISFIGSKGGQGTTLLACHVAAELAGIHRVIAIDMDMSMGDMASIMDLNPNDDISTLLPRAHRLDERMLTGSVTVHPSKVHVLAQPGELLEALEYTGDDIFNIINASARAYQYVIIDCGCSNNEATLTAMHVSDIVALIAEPTVISVRDAFRRLRLLQSQGIEKDRIRLIINRHSKSTFVSVSDIEANLGLKVAATITDDPRTVGQAMNEGKLIREVGRRTDIAQDISVLIAVMTDDTDDVQADKSNDGGGGFFFGLFGGRG
jgi:pilus assembly protein CpaE